MQAGIWLTQNSYCNGNYSYSTLLFLGGGSPKPTCGEIQTKLVKGRKERKGYKCMDERGRQGKDKVRQGKEKGRQGKEKGRRGKERVRQGK